MPCFPLQLAHACKKAKFISLAQKDLVSTCVNIPPACWVMQSAFSCFQQHLQHPKCVFLLLRSSLLGKSPARWRRSNPRCCCVCVPWRLFTSAAAAAAFEFICRCCALLPQCPIFLEAAAVTHSTAPLTQSSTSESSPLRVDNNRSVKNLIYIRILYELTIQ